MSSPASQHTVSQTTTPLDAASLVAMVSTLQAEFAAYRSASESRFASADARIASLEAQNASLMLRLVEANERSADAQERSATAQEQPCAPRTSQTKSVEDQEREAIHAFCQMVDTEGSWSIRRLAEVLDLPRSTLHRRITGWKLLSQFIVAHESGYGVRRGAVTENKVDGSSDGW